MTASTPLTPYAALGGPEAIRRLVQRFYALMDELPEAYAVRKIHPDSLAGAEDSLFKFLSGWFGGPPLYTAERGHPRLRMRHAPYRIGPAERDEWMLCMHQALAEQVADVELREAVERAFASMADHLLNVGDDAARAQCAGGVEAALP
ncbi:group II truncated hemoglobin [Variovorax sp. YR752]|uniref:group II truncated hemoglobin n=1 Tax=Variovorax sp. YR752 TaxID=1884383 RepID=UPI0031380448